MNISKNISQTFENILCPEDILKDQNEYLLKQGSVYRNFTVHQRQKTGSYKARKESQDYFGDIDIEKLHF